MKQKNQLSPERYVKLTRLQDRLLSQNKILVKRESSKGRTKFDPALARKNVVAYHRQASEQEGRLTSAQNVGRKFSQAVEDGLIHNHKVRRGIITEWRPFVESARNGSLTEDESVDVLLRFARELDMPDQDSSVTRAQFTYLDSLRRESWFNSLSQIPHANSQARYFMLAFGAVSDFNPKQRETYHQFLRREALDIFHKDLEVTRLTARFLRTEQPKA